MSTYLWIGLGGFLGANARYLVQRAAGQLWNLSFPYGTMIANVTGTFMLTFFMLLVTEVFNIRTEVRLFFATGFLGSYTTFSSFGYETWTLLQTDGWLRFGLNLLGNIVLGGIAVLAAVYLFNWLLRPT